MKKALMLSILSVLLLLSACSSNTDDIDYDYEENGYAVEDEPAEEPQEEVPPEHIEFSFSNGLDENGFWQGIRATDYVEMFNHSGLVVPWEVHQPSERDIDTLLSNLFQSLGIRGEVEPRPVEMGDIVNIDFVGSVDGVEFEGGTAFGFEVIIGVTQFIDDFLDQLIGHMPGDVVDVNVTFPDFYPQQPDLEGVPALFVTTINYIADNRLPDLTDEFVAEHFAESLGWETIEEMRMGASEMLSGDGPRFMIILEYVQSYLAQVPVRSIPQHLLIHHEQMVLAEAEAFGFEIEELFEWYGIETLEEFLELYRDEIEDEARLSLVLQAVAEDAGITATMQDIYDFFLDNMGVTDISEFEDRFGLPWLKQYIRNQMVVEYIMENIVRE